MTKLYKLIAVIRENDTNFNKIAAVVKLGHAHLRT